MDDIHEFHDFSRKLLQESLIERVRDYVQWFRRAQQARSAGQEPPPPPQWAPVSINLDLTTACNYRCDHCIDWDILNSGVKHKEEELLESLRQMAARGLKSVILIGGGEPTVYPRFVQVVQLLKELDLQVAVVSNGGRNDRIYEAVQYMTAGDWVRLSLDSGTDETFQRMHRPRQKVTLEEICGWVPRIKDRNPAVMVGFSFIVTWRGAQRDDTKIVENIHEIVPAARLAKQHRFDYFSIKPFLIRAEETGSEVLDPTRAAEQMHAVVEKIRRAVEEAKRLEDEHFKVVESTNLVLLEKQSWRQFTRQPHQCHMQFFRQVLTPHGLFNCPVYRSSVPAMIADRRAYRDAESCEQTRHKLGEALFRFDAAHHCREVTCLYHSTNWWLQDLVEHPEKLQQLTPAPDRGDYYL